MNVPFVDLKQQYRNIKSEVDAAIQNVLDETAFIKGKHVSNFENHFQEKLGVNHCIGVANGTDAIYIAMKSLGIGAGDEVITVANSWISTSETISQTGARPVFIDVDEYFTIDVDLIESKITDKTKAIIPVHLYGQVCEMDKLVALCEKYDIPMIEDSAQAHFSTYNEVYAGKFGTATTFSFYPGKNLGAYGDAGAVVTDDDELAEKMRRYANHGALVKHQHTFEGINSRLDGLQAAVLNVKLGYILDWTQQRVVNADRYNKYLVDIADIETPKVRPGVGHTYHLYVIKAERREELRSHLSEHGVPTVLHYPTPLPFLDAYQYLGHDTADFPRVHENAAKILSLPMFPEMQEDQVKFVAEKIREFYH